MSLDKFRALLPPSRISYNTGNEIGWKKIETTLKTSLPRDYKELISIYGTGGIDNFLWFLTPFTDDRNVNFLKKMITILDAYRESKNNFPELFKHSVFPESKGIIPWAYTDNGDVLYWQVINNPENWPIIVYDSRSPEFIQYNFSMFEFLIKLIKKEIICEIFPSDFPSDEPEFIAIDVK